MNCKRALRVAAMVSVMMCTLRIGEAQPGASEPGGDRLGGHIGFVLPLVTHAGGQTTTLDENFGIGFPVGITVKSSGRTSFDFEFVPFIQDTPRKVSLTVHPGLLYGLGHGFTAGARLGVRRQLLAIRIHTPPEQELADRRQLLQGLIC
jgi:hypothetical protein